MRGVVGGGEGPDESWKGDIILMDDEYYEPTITMIFKCPKCNKTDVYNIPNPSSCVQPAPYHWHGGEVYQLTLVYEG